jgi:hypothetical protein
MSVFTALPQDMLQHEIARFLTHADALNFNEVLKKDERVYKKLPKDYAIKHQIRLSYESYQEIAKALSFSLGRVNDGGWEHIHVPKAVKLLKRYFSWFKDPKNHIVLMYTKGRQARFLENIGQWTQLDMAFYEELNESEVEALRDEALELLIMLSQIPFIRNVIVADHKNAFE